MAPRPRGPKSPPPGPPPPPKTALDGFTRIYPDRLNFCKVCDREINEPLVDHFRHTHPKDSIEAYHAAFPDAPLELHPPPPPTMVGAVSDHTAQGHPGGAHAAVIQRDLPEEEQQLYLQIVKELLNSEYPKGYLLASVAYYMVLAARVRADLERLRRESGFQVGTDDRVKALDELEKRIAVGLGELEKQRREVERIRREEEKLKRHQDPVAILEAQVAEAEDWVQQHQGEFVSQCPNPECQQMLSVPDLPHWAFAPALTTHGKEWMVWSQEAWSLVVAGVIPVWVMAYTLRTSPEAVRITALRRGESWPQNIDINEQEAQLQVRLRSDDVVTIKRARLPIQVMEELVEAGLLVDEETSEDSETG